MKQIKNHSAERLSCFVLRGLTLLSLLMYLGGCSLLNMTPTPPIKIPIALHKAGIVAET